MSEEETKANPPSENPSGNQVKAGEVADGSKEGQASTEAKDKPAQEGDKANPETEEEKKAKQTREQDAIFAAKRREADEAKAKKEAQEKEDKIREAETKGKLSVLKENPYTKKPISDEHDLKIYEIQKKLDDEGKDPVNDLPDYLANQERSDDEKAKSEAESREKEERESNEKINNEIAELTSKHPDVKTEDLAKDPEFVKFSEGKFGRWTLNEIYEGYAEKKSQIQVQEKKNSEEAVKRSNPQSSTNDGHKVAKEIKDMSDEEFAEYSKKLHGES